MVMASERLNLQGGVVDDGAGAERAGGAAGADAAGCRREMVVVPRVGVGAGQAGGAGADLGQRAGAGDGVGDGDGVRAVELQGAVVDDGAGAEGAGGAAGAELSVPAQMVVLPVVGVGAGQVVVPVPTWSACRCRR